MVIMMKTKRPPCLEAVFCKGIAAGHTHQNGKRPLPKPLHIKLLKIILEKARLQHDLGVIQPPGAWQQMNARIQLIGCVGSHHNHHVNGKKKMTDTHSMIPVNKIFLR